jgi:uracil-DNA glycosylase
MTRIDPVIEESWKELLEEQFTAPYFLELKNYLLKEKCNFNIYPPGKYIFNAFNLTPANKVKAVILGQDPYHGEGQAHGLCFSVLEGVKPPPSLVNIFKELNSDTGIAVPDHGNLEKWARQGVLLLNATLTVRSGLAGSHQGRGWETFTDAAISALSMNYSGIVFLLWGRFAQAKESIIDCTRHHILKAAHPSPFSAYNGFIGCRPFSKTNQLLASQGKEPIDWSL